MSHLKFLMVGVMFGIVLAKAEVVSWYRIYEMFRFDAFHMYGVIGSAVILGAIIVALIKRTHLKSIYGSEIQFTPKAKSMARYIIGGSIFGLGWAMVGACPGPMYILLGSGFTVMIVVIASAFLGTLAYGAIRDKLPH